MPALNLPWLTGPLLTPAGHVVPKGHINIEPYNYFTVNTGIYDGKRKHHSLPHKFVYNFPFLIQMGIADNLEMDIVPQLVSNHQNGHHFTSIGDSTVQLKYQVQNDPYGLIKVPANFAILQTFPTGKYQKFSPGHRTVQGTGQGAFTTTFSFTTTRLYHVHKESYFAWRNYLAYGVSSKVHVHGFNAYGGGFHANGYVYPGNEFSWLFGWEYSLNRHWALACDVAYNNQAKTHFSGNPGTNPDGSIAINSLPSSWQWSLAPALEYNFNFHIGVIAGVWFSFAGRNAAEFVSGVIAVNLYY